MKYRCGTCKKSRSLKDAEVETETLAWDLDHATGVGQLTLIATKLCPVCGEVFATADIKLECEVSADKWTSALDEAEWEQV